MNLRFKKKYSNLSDKEIVEKIITEPYDDEAAVYLIYDRYEPLLISTYKKTLEGVCELIELQNEFFMILKGKKQDWHALRTFQWRSSLGSWFSIMVYNLSLELRKKLIDNGGITISLDEGWTEEKEKTRKIDIPVNEEAQYERRCQEILLQEAINRLDNPDHKFVVMKRLQGYSSKEIAIMLQTYWSQNNIVRYNNKKEVVVPDSGYIDNLFKRGYDKMIKIYNFLNK